MKRLLSFITISAIALAMAAKPIDDAKALYADGNYAEAITKLEAILKSAPRDMTANYYLGMSYIGLGELEKAKAPLMKAEDRGSVSAAKALAQLAIDQYRMDDATDHLDTWEKLVKKGKRNAEIPEEINEMRTKAVTARNMLERVEKIAIIDSIVVDKADFFKHYRLSPQAGKLIDGNILPRQYADKLPNVVFEPENDKEVFWAMPQGDDGLLGLYNAQILDDGTFENPERFGEELGEGGDADFLYLASDGMTFYYANNGENSLGGYDIFMSRRDADGSVLNPQNMGMPYNSPYDDYMLVIDEAAGLGWWATDRNQIEDKVTIYVFVPNDTRENYDPDDEAIGDYAFIRSIKATQSAGKNRSLLTDNQALTRSSDAGANKAAAFEISMGNGKVYTSMSDFRSEQGRQAMQQYLDRQNDLQLMQTKLAMLRRRYSDGDKSTADEIRSLEKRVAAARGMMKRLRNAVVSAER